MLALATTLLLMACEVSTRVSGFAPGGVVTADVCAASSMSQSASSTAGSDTSSTLETLEFYSGIGGLRISLEEAARAASKGRNFVVNVQGAYEINTVANLVYEHNFEGSTVTRKSIEHLVLHDVDGMSDMWMMSPPCQPFCKVGKQLDVDDPRSLSFLHLLSLLEASEEPPRHVFVENVVGFQGSRAHSRLLQVLDKQGFDVTELLLSPVHCDVPNTRLRYYCLATRPGDSARGREAPVTDGCILEYFAKHRFSEGREDNVDQPLRPLSEFLDANLEGEAAAPYVLSSQAAALGNTSLRFDIVTSRSKATTTFTKGYGKHAGRAGPVLLLSNDGRRRVSGDELHRFPEGMTFGPPHGRELRWFSDREMLRLHGFPETFTFPSEVSLRQRFALIGNSVSVDVVSRLLRGMLFAHHAGEG